MGGIVQWLVNLTVPCIVRSDRDGWADYNGFIATAKVQINYITKSVHDSL